MNRFSLPDIGFGLGLRSPHYDDYLRHRPKLGWLEIITENFIDAHGGYRDFLADLRQDYQFAMHGVSLSIGSTDALDREYLGKIKNLADFLQPAWISDHLCFTGIMGKNTHDLLPVPYTEEALQHIAKRVRMVQEMLERPILLENPSTYITFDGSTMEEHEFIAELAREADCALLLDVNNVVVSAFNHGVDAREYIDAIPADRVVQIHLAGHTDKEDYKIDTHDREVADDVWDLYRYTIQRMGQKSTMIEWDEKVPTFDVLYAEIEKARELVESIAPPLAGELGGTVSQKPTAPIRVDAPVPAPPASGESESLIKLQTAILDKNPSLAIDLLGRKTPSLGRRLDAYINGYRIRLHKVVEADYPATRHYLGNTIFAGYVEDYVERTHSNSYTVDQYPLALADYLAKHCEDQAAIDLARLESTIAEVFWLPDSSPFIPDADFSMDKLMNLTLHHRTASKMLTFATDAEGHLSAFRAGTIAENNARSADRASHEPAEQHSMREPAGEHRSNIIVLRHQHTIKRHRLTRAEATLLAALNGKPFASALEQAIADYPDHAKEMQAQLGEWLGKWIREGFFRANVA